MKNKIFCTVGPKSLNRNFLHFSRKNIDLLRINMSHVDIRHLEKIIKYIQRYTKTPICIDTEGAQIRTKIKKEFFLKKFKKVKISKNFGNFRLYPDTIFEKLKNGDILDIGFDGLEIKILNKNLKVITASVLQAGYLKTNKGVHLKNRKIKINYLTPKDFLAIKIAQKNKIKHFALSFTNSVNDVKKFNDHIKKETKIYKLETKLAVKNIRKILKSGKNFLIDRGDLSKDISIEYIPIAQRKIISLGNKLSKNIYVATNFLESMILNSTPTRGEVNDIYNTLEMGSKGLVLAAETAIGKYPIECVKILKKIMKLFQRNKKIK